MATQRVVKQTKAVRKPLKAVKNPAQRTQQASRSAAVRTPTRGVGGDDYEAVRQVLSRYCFALDRGQLKALGALFHRDAVFAVSFENGKRHTGRETIQSWYEHFFQQRPEQYRHMRHKIFEPLLTVNRTTATATTYFDADSVEENGSVRVVAGRYDDVLVKDSGQWFFKERTIHVLYHYSPGVGQEGM